MSSLIKELLEMGEYEEYSHKKYDKGEEAKQHASEFLDKAAEILSHNKKEGSNDEVTKLAQQLAKDYHEAIIDAIQHKRYTDGEPSEPYDEEGVDIEPDGYGPNKEYGPDKSSYY